jgi:hypothetical protein
MPQPYHPKLSDFKIAASAIIPQTEGPQNVVFSDTVSASILGNGIDEITAPPLTVAFHQRIGMRDVLTGQSYLGDHASSDFQMMSSPAATWMPGQWTVSMKGKLLSLTVRQIALHNSQGFVEVIDLMNESSIARQVDLFSVQQPSIARPEVWGYGRTISNTQSAAECSVQDGVLVQSNSSGSIAVASRGLLASTSDSLRTLVAEVVSGLNRTERRLEHCTASATRWRLNIPANASTTVYVVIATSPNPKQAKSDAMRILRDPAVEVSSAREFMQEDLDEWFRKLPALSSSSPELSRFYYHAAAQLFYDRWRLGKTALFDPWYPVSGRDSGGMNLYVWDVQYAAQAFTFLDPQSLRKILKALPAAPMTEHYAIDFVKGKGMGPFYAYNSYAYTSSVDQYLATTGDTSLLAETISGKTVLDWLITLAEQGEKDKDPDGNDLLDYGDDSNLLELHKTGSGPGYVNEVPSPNGQRAYVYRTVADLMESVDPQRYHEKISHFQDMAARVAKALNNVLWLDNEGWYGTRQRDGSVVPVYTVQVLELLRFPGLIPQNRARRLVEHLNDNEFVAPWGIRSMSIKDRLFDYNDHDWGGAISYSGTGPELSADLFAAGFPGEGWMSLKKILWWPDHMAVYPQGIANDSYTSRFSQAASFGGRVTGGRSNIIVGVAGVEAVLRGVFGLEMGRDGSIKVSNNLVDDLGPSAVAIPFRHRIWTATQTLDGLNLRSDDGFDASLFQPGGSIRVSINDARIRIGVSSRTAKPGRLSISLDYLMRELTAQKTDQLVFRLQGTRMQPQYREGVVLLSIDTTPMEKELQITVEPIEQTSTRQ